MINLLKNGANIKVKGPFGYPIADNRHTNVNVVVGTGTGIVPMISLMEERAQRLALLGKASLTHVRTARRESCASSPCAAVC